MANYDDFNKVQPGASDIDREAWPVMYDPYGGNNMTEVSTKDSDTIDFSGKGTTSSKLRADVKIDPSENNAIQTTEKGLFVLSESSILDIVGSRYINVEGGRAKTISLKMSADEANDLGDNEGLFVHVPVKNVGGSEAIDVARDGDDFTVTALVSKEPNNTIDIREDGLFAENFVKGTADTESVVLAVDENGLVSATAVPSAFDGKVEIEYDNATSTVKFSGKGTSEEPLTATVDIPIDQIEGVNPITTTKTTAGTEDKIEIGLQLSDLADNGAEIKSEEGHEGLYVPVAPVQTVSDTSTVVLDIDGHKDLSASVKLSQAPGNAIEDLDGLFVPEDLIKGISSSDSVVLAVDGNSVLSATAVPSALDEKVKVKVIENWQANTIEFYGDGTEGNPIGAEIVDSSLDGKVGISTDSYNEYNVHFSGSGKEGDPLLGEVDVSDRMTAVETEDTNTVSFRGTGWTNDELKAEVKITSSHPDNILQAENDGLYVPSTVIPDEFIQAVANTESVVLAVDGNAVLTASATPSAFNGRVEIEYDNANSDVQFSGKGTTENPLTATVDFPIDLIEGTNPITAELDPETDKVNVGLQVSTKQKNLLEIVEDLGEEGLYAPDLNPMTEEGDIVYAGPSGVPEALGIGQEGQVLMVGPSAVPEWTTLPPSPIRDVSDTTTVDLEVDGDGVLSADVIISDASGNALTDDNGLYAPELYLGAFSSSNRPQDATTGQYILDTDLGYVIFRDGGAWVNAAGGVEEGVLVPPSGTPDYVQNPMTGAGDLIVGGSDGYPERLAPGTDGQLLSIVSGEPTWIDHNRHSVENYCIVSSTNKMELGGYANKMYTNLVIPGTSGEYNKLGFFHLSGTVGYVMLGIYDASGNLVCTTPLTEPTSDTVGTVCWIDATAPFRLEAGEVYQMAFYSTKNGYNNNINPFILEKDPNNLFSNYLAGEVNLTESEFPATKPAVGFSDRVPWMGAKE